MALFILQCLLVVGVTIYVTTNLNAVIKFYFELRN
jgi:hypothetical protein